MAEMDGNLFENLAFMHPGEQFLDLIPAGMVKIERIVSPAGETAPSAWYCQDRAEWVMLARGSAAILFEGEAAPRRMKSGDYLLIPARRRHRVEWTDANEPVIWLAVHFQADHLPDGLIQMG